MHKPTLLQEPSLLFCKQQLVMSLSNPQCVVGWFSFNYSTSKDTVYGGRGFDFLDACFSTSSIFLGFF